MPRSDALQGLSGIGAEAPYPFWSREEAEVFSDRQTDIPVAANAVPVYHAIRKADIAPGGVVDQ